jgi:4-hydroxy-tetrahydrodipicolinate reductase
MGRAIERVAIARGHEIVAIVDPVSGTHSIDSPAFASADTAIEFTAPAVAVDNYLKAFAAGVPVVSGTTGWTSQMEEVTRACRDTGGTFLWTSNFSIGVNLFFRLNTFLAKLMEPFPQYRPSIKEIHHVHKLDHPSGTAITLAQEIAAASSRVDHWSEDPQSPETTLVIEHERVGEVPGTHIVGWRSAIDDITIEHRAHSREGFATGAVMAAEWAASRKGVLTLDQMINDLLNDI